YICYSIKLYTNHINNIMGKGDIKTKKGKRAAGSYGVTRPRKVKKNGYVAQTPKAKADTPEKKESKSTAKKATTAKKTTTKKASTSNETKKSTTAKKATATKKSTTAKKTTTKKSPAKKTTKKKED